MIKAIISFFTTIILIFNSIAVLKTDTSVSEITVDTTKTGNIIPNIVSNINLWNKNSLFNNRQRNEKYDIFEFVEYIQLMQCSGGTAERDLFKDPYDTSTMTDYDFSSLIESCEIILNLGAKPHLKLGSVPIKYSKNAVLGGFDMNIYPPDDYNVYYNYIKSITQVLVDKFGKEEVLSWRFGCMTEFENSNWFQADTDAKTDYKKAKDAKEAYCKLYDFTVQALVDVLGDDVFVGAHSMTVTEGLWDEREFIKHVAKGKNYATGEKGTHISFLSFSFYDSSPGNYTEGMTIEECVEHLKDYAQRMGLDDLIYGVDEGRLLTGNNSGKIGNELYSRTVGYTWQGAYDARVFKMSIDNSLDYFSSWSFLSNDLTNGIPTISYHIAKNIAEFAGSNQVETKVITAKAGLKKDIQVDCLSAWNCETNTLRLMIYNFKNDINYSNDVQLKINIEVPQFDNKEVIVIKKLVNDECNYFDEWQDDRVKYNITDDCFDWSPDDPCLDNSTTLHDKTAIEIYQTQLKDKYEEYATLVPTQSEIKVVDSEIQINETLCASNVAFYEIKLK